MMAVGRHKWILSFFMVLTVTLIPASTHHTYAAATLHHLSPASNGPPSATLQVPSIQASRQHTLNAGDLPKGPHKTAPINGRIPPVSQLYFAEGFTGQGPAVNFSERLNIFNTNPITASGSIEYFLNSGLASTVPITVPAYTQLSEDVNNDVGANQAVSALIELDQAIVATRTISRTTSDGTVLGESSSSGINGLAQFWYFAEGYTGASFQEYLALFNPGNTPASVIVQPVGKAGAQPAAPLSETVPAHARVTVNVRAAVPGQSLGLSVQSDQPIAAERVLYWGSGAGSAKYGAAVNAGIQGPAALWTFPYVSTSNKDQAFLAFIDPTTVAAHVQLTTYTGVGSHPMPPIITIQPGARSTVSIPSDGGPIGIVASSDVPVIAEQGQYFGGSPNIGMHGGSVLAGTPQPAIHWAFADPGTDQYSSQSWYILNRGSTKANLTATLYTQNAQPLEAHFTAAPGRLTTIGLENLHDLQGNSPSVWNSSVPVVIVQMLHGSYPGSGAIIAGINID